MNNEQTEDQNKLQTPPDAESTPADEPKPEAKYTDEDVDNIVKKRLARAAAKAEEEKQQAVDEAAKLAKMNADQKRDYEAEKTAKALEDANAKLARYEMRATARAMFEDAEVDVTDADLEHVIMPEADSTKANVNWLLEHDKAVAERVRKEYLKGSTPKVNGHSMKPVAKTDFDQMTAAERADLFKSDPEQFKKLTGGY